ncbi:LPXTG cell wall anchor domain-containing protein [Rothia nasimurium]|uniref:LPXTG cell wall anchor domain-containing protein n=1 Tax=Rothia nasimurium TaxID=85336 RepID=UPI003BA09744
MAAKSHTKKIASGMAVATLAVAGSLALTPTQAVEAPAPEAAVATTAPAPEPTAEAPSSTVTRGFHVAAGTPVVFGKVIFPADAAQPAGAVISPDGLTLTVPGEGVWTLLSSAGFSFTPEPTFQGTPQSVIFAGTGISGAVRTVNYTLSITGLITEVTAGEVPPAEPTEAPAEPTVAPAEPTVAPAEPTAAPAEPTDAPVEATPDASPAPGDTPAPGQETPGDPSTGTGTEVKAEATAAATTTGQPAAEEKKAEPKAEAKKEETKELAKTGASPLLLAGIGAALLAAGFYVLRRRTA